VGKAQKFGLSDIFLESAITAIMDCEDSVAAVDAFDKAKVYTNWAGMMKGTLSAKMPNGLILNVSSLLLGSRVSPFFVFNSCLGNTAYHHIVVVVPGPSSRAIIESYPAI